MEITETKQDFVYGEYTARTFFGEYGTHIDWFKGEAFLKTEEIPNAIQEQHEKKIEEILY